MIYHWNGQEWKKCKPVLIHCTYMAYSLHWKQHTEFDPQLLPPATPSLDSSQTFLILQLPICVVCTIPSTMPRAPFNLLECLCTPPLEWVLPLWHRIWPMAPLDSMLKLIQQQKHLIISSNASVDAAKHSCCAWSIHSTTTLWHSEGIVPGNYDDTYSGQSEAFGLLTALMFIHHYLQHYPYQQPLLQSPLMVYCDNGSTITEATKYSNFSDLYPNQTLADDHDIYQEIAQTVVNLPQFSIHFIHVKGHQNRGAQK